MVEDDEINQSFISKLINKKYNVFRTSSADEAFSVSKGNHIQLILMDISVKGETNGLQLTKLIREIKEYSEIPIIAVTAHAFKADRQKSIEAGCNDYLSKPFTSKELMEKFRALFKS